MTTVYKAFRGVGLVWLAMAGVVHASVLTWTGSSSTDYSNTGNWSPATVPGSSDVAYFNALSYGNNAGLTEAKSLAGLWFGTGATGTSVNISGAYTLSLGAGHADSANYGLYAQNNPGTNSINVTTLDLTAAQSWYVQSGGTLDISNAVVSSSGGAYALTNSGGGALVLRGKNTFSGPLVVQGGTTVRAVARAAGDGSPLGSTTAAVTLNGGILSVASTVNTARQPVQKGDVNFSGANIISLSHAGTGSYVTNQLNKLIQDTTYGGVLYISGVTNKGAAATDMVLVTDPSGSSSMTTNPNGYLPGTYIYGAGTKLVYDASAGPAFTPLAYDSVNGFSVAPWVTNNFNSNDCVQIKSATIFNTDTNCWALYAAGFTVSGSGTINVYGGFVEPYNGTLSSALNFGSLPGVICENYKTAAGTLSGDFKGTAGIVKAGNNPITITYASGTRSFTGPVYILGGSLTLTTSGALGVPANPVVFNGGTLMCGVATFDHPISVGPVGGIFNFTGNSALVSNITGVGVFNIYSGGSTPTATISGPNNTYSGGTLVTEFTTGGRDYTINVTNFSSLGTGGLTIQTRVGSATTVNLQGTSNLVATAPVVFAPSGLLKMSAAGTYQIGSLTATNGTLRLGSTSGTTVLSVGNDNTSTTFGGTITTNAVTGAIAALTKVGTGTLTLTGTNFINGATTVSNGTLVVNGSISNGAVRVVSGATLSGVGTVSGVVTNFGTLAPAGTNAMGTLTVGSLEMESGSVAVFELGTIGSSDQVTVTSSSLTFKSGSSVHVTPKTGFGVGTYTLFTCGGTFAGALPSLSIAGGYSGQLAIDGNKVVLVVSTSGTTLIVQ